MEYLSMAQFIYIDETGSVGSGAASQPHLTLAAVIVSEDKVIGLAKRLREITWEHLGWVPPKFEFHGHELWQGSGHWAKKSPAQLIEAYEAAIAILEELDLFVSYASIHKGRLHERYSGSADSNAYRLALQFLLEKIDRTPGNKILVADEAKHERLAAINMVANMQEWGSGEVRGDGPLKTVIDCLHYVDSSTSPGVQMADLVVYILQRHERRLDSHPSAAAAIQRLRQVIVEHTLTWREPWPPA